MLDTKTTGAFIKEAPYKNQRSKNMKVKMLRNTIIDGKVAYAGEVVDVKKSDLPRLLTYGKAKLYDKEKKTKSVETATADPKENEVSRSNKSKKDK